MPTDLVHTPPPIWIPSNALILGLAMAGLCILAWITAKDIVAEEWRFFLLEMRLRKAKQKMPEHEKLGFATRFIDGTRHLFFGRPHLAALDLDEREPQNIFRLRVRKEIDRLVGREEYHGQKEQL